MNPNISFVASLISDPSRGVILTKLMDGRMHTASELANTAKITPQTASYHLTKMIEGNMIKVKNQGRHRYFGLANQDIAELLESFFSFSPVQKVSSLREFSEKEAIKSARTCYDHLAGYAGVAITNGLLKEGYLMEQNGVFETSNKGNVFFSSLGIDISFEKAKRRSFAKCCLDWTERRHHLGGALGNALLTRMFDSNWIKRIHHSRAVTFTPLGKKEIKEIFNVQL
jgi:DNA-binding transcriptional ArsR family regulator